MWKSESRRAQSGVVESKRYSVPPIRWRPKNNSGGYIEGPHNINKYG